MTLYYIMKSYFYDKQYIECNIKLVELNQKYTIIENSKRKIFLKIKAKIMLYSLIINFIYNDLEKSKNLII